MSLGWQTESALLPSKAKPIKVDNKTLINLKSLVYQKEQQQKLERQHHSSSSRFNHLHVSKRFNSEEKTVDLKTTEETDISATEKASLALAGKAKLYEKLMQEGFGSRDIGSASLIDFSRKRQNEEIYNDEPEEAYPPKEAPSSLSISFRQVQGFGQWQWSRGSGKADTHDHNKEEDEAAYIAKHRTERDLQRAAEQAIEYANLSQGARVKSQWEKNLNSDAKQIALELHQEIETHRQLQSETASSQNSNNGGGKSIREERLEMLKRKRQKLGFNPTAAASASSSTL